MGVSEAKYTIFLLFLLFEKRFIFNDFLFSLSDTHALPCTHAHWQTRRYHAPAEYIKQQDLSPSPYPRWRTAALPVGKQSVYHPSNRMRALSPARLALFLVRCSCEYGARWQDMTPHCVRLGDKLELWGFHSRTKNRYTHTYDFSHPHLSLSFYDFYFRSLFLPLFLPLTFSWIICLILECTSCLKYKQASFRSSFCLFSHWMTCFFIFVFLFFCLFFFAISVSNQVRAN